MDEREASSVTWSAAAKRDIQEIESYIALDSPIRAIGFVQRLKDKTKSLTLFPQRGRMVPELQDPGVREVFVKSYRLIYHYREREVHIIRVIHGARDLSQAWGERDVG